MNLLWNKKPRSSCDLGDTLIAQLDGVCGTSRHLVNIPRWIYITLIYVRTTTPDYNGNPLNSYRCFHFRSWYSNWMSSTTKGSHYWFSLTNVFFFEKRLLSLLKRFLLYTSRRERNSVSQIITFPYAFLSIVFFSWLNSHRLVCHLHVKKDHQYMNIYCFDSTLANFSKAFLFSISWTCKKKTKLPQCQICWGYCRKRTFAYFLENKRIYQWHRLLLLMLKQRTKSLFRASLPANERK